MMQRSKDLLELMDEELSDYEDDGNVLLGDHTRRSYNSKMNRSFHKSQDSQSKYNHAQRDKLNE
jgi:hypothetical protein